MATDNEIRDFLANGDPGADIETNRKGGQTAWDAAKFFGEDERSRVRMVARQNRSEIDREIRRRLLDAGPAGYPFVHPGGHTVGDLISAGASPATGVVSAAVWVPDADYTRNNVFTQLEIDGPDPDYLTLAMLDTSAITNGAGVYAAGVPVTMDVSDEAITLADLLWFQSGGTSLTPIPSGTIYLVIE